MQREKSAITDIQNSTEKVTVELDSLIEEQIPKYQLRANKALGYDQVGWIETPVLPPFTNTDLSSEQCEETFKLFLLSGTRLSQMTRTYHDVEAVMHLLEEKERDLELAARIGQTLLIKNKAIAQQNEMLEDKLTHAVEEASQLRHEVSMKEDLLHIYTDVETDSSGSASPVKDLKVFGRLQSHMDSLHSKIEQLERDNADLLEEKSHVHAYSEEIEEKEHVLVTDTVKQLNVLQYDLKSANTQILAVTEELTRRNDETTKQQDEISGLLNQIVDLQKKHKQMTSEHEELQLHLSAANKSQYELSQEVQNLESRYHEVLCMLDETREETRMIRDSSLHSNDGWYDTDSTTTWQIPFQNSLAAELEISDIGFDVDDHSDAEGLSIDQKHSISTSSSLRNFGPKRSQKCVLRPAQCANRWKKHHSPEPNCSCDEASSASQRPRTLQGKKSLWTIGSPPTISLVSPSMGRPGVPGTADLERAIEKLAKVGKEGLKFVEEAKCQMLSNLCEHDFDLATVNLASTSSLQIHNMRKCMSAPKLRIVKPLEGSLTLHNWKLMADYSTKFRGIDEDSQCAPGIVVRCNIPSETKQQGIAMMELHPSQEHLNSVVSRQSDVAFQDNAHVTSPSNAVGNSGSIISASSTIFSSNLHKKESLVYESHPQGVSPLNLSPSLKFGVKQQMHSTSKTSKILEASKQENTFADSSPIRTREKCSENYVDVSSIRSVRSSPHLLGLVAALLPETNCRRVSTSSLTSDNSSENMKSCVDWAHLHGRNPRWSEEL